MPEAYPAPLSLPTRTHDDRPGLARRVAALPLRMLGVNVRERVDTAVLLTLGLVAMGFMVWLDPVSWNGDSWTYYANGQALLGQDTRPIYYRTVGLPIIYLLCGVYLFDTLLGC